MPKRLTARTFSSPLFESHPCNESGNPSQLGTPQNNAGTAIAPTPIAHIAQIAVTALIALIAVIFKNPRRLPKIEGQDFENKFSPF